jgi:Asp-tRNA(Asn)/Glu-tRNA(Gln) amidotransferase A subunit family amidase
LKTMNFGAILIIVVAGVLLSLVRDVAISLDPPVVKLGEGGYDIRPLESPVATGWKLQFLSYLLAESPIGGILRRALLNKNEFFRLRELSAQITSMPPLHHPVKRLTAEERSLLEGKQDGSLYDHFAKILLDTENEDGTSFQMDHPRRSVRYYHEQYKNGVKPSTVIANTLAVIEDWKEDHKLNIFAKILPQEVMQAARESDARYAEGRPLSLLDGIPIAVKDMIHIRDHTSYNGKSPKTEHRAGWVEPTEDDTIVRRLREAGAILLGTTIMTEGGVTPLGWSAHWQGPYNVYNFDRYCGGSSSGSAVAVAAGLVPAAIGFDGGGSIRIPASMSGIHGMGTTFGRLPFDGNLETTMIKGGPMTATAEDAALVYSIISENEPGHFYSQIYDGDKQGPPAPSLEQYSDVDDLSDVRIGFWKEWFEDADQEVVDASYAALNYLESKGATIVPIEIQHLRYMSLAHAAKITSEFAIKFDHLLHSRPESLEPNTKVTIAVGSTSSALEVLSGERLRAWGFKAMEDLMANENLSCILTPTIAVLPPHLSEDARTHGESNNPLTIQLMKYIFLGNYLGLPGYSLNVGYSSPSDNNAGSRAAVPIGLQLLGRHWGEHHLFRLAHVLEMWQENEVMLPPVFYDPFALTK